jgi:hypothetical protein
MSMGAVATPWCTNGGACESTDTSIGLSYFGSGSNEFLCSGSVLTDHGSCSFAADGTWSIQGTQLSITENFWGWTATCTRQ